MKKIFVAIIAMFSIHAMAQSQSNAVLSGHINDAAGKTLTLTNASRFKKQVDVDKAGDFKVSLHADSGYYAFNGTLIYLEPGCDVIMSKTDSVYSFKGKGATENNLLKEINHLPYEFLLLEKKTMSKMFALEPDDFLSRLDKYKTGADQVLNSKNLMPFFKRTQKQKVEYNARYLAYYYLLNYGVDQEKMKAAMTLLASPKPGQSSSERVAEIIAANNAMRTKSLSREQRSTLNMRIWENFDINNEDLYKFSPEYIYLIDYIYIHI